MSEETKIIKKEEKKEVGFLAKLRAGSFEKMINGALNDKSKANQFIANISTAITQNPSLNECEPATILSAGLQANSLNLPIGGQLGFAYLIPYKGKCQFQIGYKGLIQLAIRSGQYETLGTRVVHKGEYLGVDEFGEEKFKFSNDYENEEVIGYFAYIKLLNGFKKTMFMSKNQIEKHANKYSSSYKFDKDKTSLWNTNFDTMAQKTVLKLLISKYGIQSVELQQAIKYDQAVIKENGEVDYIDNPKNYKKDVVVDTLGEINE